MKRLLLILIVLTNRMIVLGQCTNCTELFQLSNGDFSSFTGPMSILSAPCAAPTPPYGPVLTTSTYFSNSNLPNWLRITGAPSAGSGDVYIRTFDEGGGHWCRTVGNQSIATNYPFLANGQYEVVLNFDEWYNRCVASSNISVGAFATSGLTEPTTPSDYVEGPFTLTAGSELIGSWAPSVGHSEYLPSSQSLCLSPLASNHDQLLISFNQNTVETYPVGHGYAGQPRGFDANLKSVQVRLCNECPTDLFEIATAGSTDPVTGTPFSSGGLFIDAAISISGTPVFSNNTSVNTMLTGKWIAINNTITADHSFEGKVAPGKFFLIVPNESCAQVNPPCGPISGEATIGCWGTVIFSASPPGGTWSSSHPSLVSISPSGVATGLGGTMGTTVTITYTNGNCILTKDITYSCLMKPEINPTNEIALQSNTIEIYPNPATEEISIIVPQNENGKIDVKILDIRGVQLTGRKTVLDGSTSRKIDIHIGSLTPGMYLADVRINDKHIVKQFVKK
jgi:hypothetical protein